MDAKIDGLSIEDAINVITQKHYKDLTPKDYAFLKAREDYLTESQKRIYLEGEDPRTVLQESGRALTQAERIIDENRPLQDREVQLREAEEKAAAALREPNEPKTPEQRTEAQEKEAEDRKATAESLAEQAEAVKKSEEEAAEVAAEKSPERVALETEAAELGVSFRSNTSDETLAKKVEEARA